MCQLVFLPSIVDCNISKLLSLRGIDPRPRNVTNRLQIYLWHPSWKVTFPIYCHYEAGVVESIFLDFEVIDIDLAFVCVADLWAEIYTYLFCSHFGRHLGNLHFQAIATARVRFPDLDIIEIDTLFVFVADQWAEIYKYLFYRPFWQPSWKVLFASYCHYNGLIAWPWCYRNRLLTCLYSWPMTWDVKQFVGVNNYFVLRVSWNTL